MDFKGNSTDLENATVSYSLALQFPQHVTAYLHDELDHQAIYGPFASKSFGFLGHMTFYIYAKYTIGDMYPSFDAFYLRDKCCFEMENLVTAYKLPTDYVSEVFCIIVIYLQPFQILKWRKVYGGQT